MRLPAALLVFSAACAPASFGETRTAPRKSTSGSTPSSPTTPSTTETTPTTPSTTDTTPTDTTPPITTDGSIVEGVDVSRWQGAVDWDAVAADGWSFAMVKATEGTYYESPTFADQYDGSYGAGLIRGSYHFAIPDDSGGAEQADYFVDRGGGWSADGRTLPGVLDIEWNPYSADACYGLSDSQMASWISDFVEQYADRTGRYPMIYTAASWWSQCASTSEFGADVPLWVAHYGAVAPNLPQGWAGYDFWQYASDGAVDGVSGNCDVNTFRGTWLDLVDFATNP